MGRWGFSHLGNRYPVDAKNEPLLKIDGVVPWALARASCGVAACGQGAYRGRDASRGMRSVVMFKTILCAPTISRTTKLSIRSRRTACRSCDFWGWVEGRVEKGVIDRVSRHGEASYRGEGGFAILRDDEDDLNDQDGSSGRNKHEQGANSARHGLLRGAGADELAHQQR